MKPTSIWLSGCEGIPLKTKAQQEYEAVLKRATQDDCNSASLEELRAAADIWDRLVK
jgi:hypothetical protein